MRAPRSIPHYTVADYQLWEGDWELIDGVAHAMTPSPIRKHSRLLIELTRQLGNELVRVKDTCSHCEIVLELDWVVNNDIVLRPDIAITCNDNGKFITKAPVVIIEVLSPATAIRDRNVKFEIYEEQGVQYYILANPESALFEVFVLRDGKYVSDNDTIAFNLPEGCTINLSIAELFAELG